MDAVITIGLPLALGFIMLSLGLGLTISDFTRVLQAPRAFLLGAFGQLIVLPLVAFALVSLSGLNGVMAVGVFLLACAPGGTTTNVLSKIASGNVALSVSLTAVISLVSVVTLPLIVAFATSRYLATDAGSINVVSIGVTMFTITAVPVAIGMVLRALLRKLLGARADGLERLVLLIAMVFFALIVVAAIATNIPLLREHASTLAPLTAIMIIIMLALGMLIARFGGLDGRDAKTIAIECGLQNTTLSMNVAALMTAMGVGAASGNALDGSTLGALALPAAVYSIVMYLIGVPFVLWCRYRASN